MTQGGRRIETRELVKRTSPSALRRFITRRAIKGRGLSGWLWWQLWRVIPRLRE